LKIDAAVSNARAVLDVQKAHGSLDAYLWSFVNGKPQVNTWRQMSDIPASTPRSVAMSKALEKLGFRFVGPTIMYAFMQAVGMVNDHVVDCFRYKELTKR
ncbi:MAG: DNA-3-methyladenine glycosylase I, partial [SAR202 cluster bacterium]|nr:DNA-3-methyladenine glycosylase I [SAR202 cluster bacterium]